MYARHRTRSFGVAPSGAATAIASGVTSRTQGPGYITEVCDDVVGNLHGDNLFSLTKTATFGWMSSGKVTGFYDPVVNWKGGSAGVLSQDSSIPSADARIAKGLSLTNPNRPVVSLPTFIFELQDIPRMLKDWGKRLMQSHPVVAKKWDLRLVPRSVAKSYIEYQFGFLPFYQDLSKIIDFQRSVDKKLRMLDNMAKHPGGTAAGATVFSTERKSAVSGQTYVSDLYQEGRWITYRDTYSDRSWISTRWEPLIDIPRTVEDRSALAYRLAFGLDLSFATVWQAMPWSWLIDWFTNIGDIMDQTRNTIPVAHAGCCLMRHTRTTRALVSRSVNLTDIWFPVQSEFKARSPYTKTVPNFSFDIPFLNGNQMAILNSLAMLKLPRT